MNRLIIVGNGFDLAHQMKTSYFDFIFDYIKNCFLEAEQEGKHEDHLGLIQKNYTEHMRQSVASLDKLEDFIDFVEPDNAEILHAWTETSLSNKRIAGKTYSWKIPDKFIEVLFRKCQEYRWVDIENEYYEALKAILGIKGEKEKQTALNTLNNSFQSLTNLLEKYLSNIKPAHINPEYRSLFYGPLLDQNAVIRHSAEASKPRNLLILNFNYTDTINLYTKDDNSHLQTPHIKINYIHGQLGDKQNPIIFGFGDELDSNYSEIEAEKTKGFLKYIKSFGYFKNSNYHDLIRFVGSDPFQVSILGHSCGLSDRTMLNMIFEHPNCDFIKIFYHGTSDKNNFTTLTEEISRHFNDKRLMRKRIVPFDKSTSMPQVTP